MEHFQFSCSFTTTPLKTQTVISVYRYLWYSRDSISTVELHLYCGYYRIINSEPWRAMQDRLARLHCIDEQPYADIVLVQRALKRNCSIVAYNPVLYKGLSCDQKWWSGLGTSLSLQWLSIDCPSESVTVYVPHETTHVMWWEILTRLGSSIV